MVGSVRDLFFHPDTFFAQLSQEKVGLIWPLVIVVLGSVVNFGAAVLLSPPVTDPLSQYTITFLSYLASALATWVFITTGLFLLSKAFSGSGSYLLTFQNTGYGMLPFVFLSASTSITVALITGNAASLTSLPPEMFSGVIYLLQLVFTIWAGYLWVCGIRNAQGIPTPLAIASVVIVLALALAIFFILTTMSLH